MSKEIKNYLHLYLGCECERPSDGKKFTLKPISLELAYIDKWKPILRPLSDMTHDEAEKLGYADRMHFSNWLKSMQLFDLWKPNQFFFLLSKHFDLFGLINAGLAIDKTPTKHLEIK